MIYKRVNILNSEINMFDKMSFVRRAILEYIQNKRFGYICVSNVHTVVMGAKDENFRNITNDSLMSVSDGVPLLWASKMLTGEKYGRCAGPDIMEDFFANANNDGLRHYFYGSTEKVLELMIEKLSKKYPKLEVAGYYSPPFRDMTSIEIKDVFDKINESKADIIWVGLGAPKQEIWMSKNWSRSKSIMIGVGAAFDFFADTKKRAPLWMQKNGLEWLYRLLSEPNRLFKRYLITNTLFVMYLMKQLLMNNKSRSST